MKNIEIYKLRNNIHLIMKINIWRFTLYEKQNLKQIQNLIAKFVDKTLGIALSLEPPKKH